MSRGAATLAALLALAACGPGGQPPAWGASPAAVVDLRVSVSPTEVPLMQPVTVTVDLAVPLPLVPPVLQGDFPLAVPLSAESTQQVSRFWGSG